MPNETVTPADAAGLVGTLRSMSRDDNTRACVSVNITVSNDLAKKLFDALHAAPKAATVLEALSAENERLRKALRPFAVVADLIDNATEGAPDESMLELRRESYVVVSLRISPFRTARRALEGGE